MNRGQPGKRLEKLWKSLVIIVPSMIALLLPDRLIPYQLDWLGSWGSLALVGSLLIGWKFGGALQGRFRAFAIAFFIGLAFSAIIQLFFVVKVDGYGVKRETFTFLVGFVKDKDFISETLPDETVEHLTNEDLIRRLNDSNIPKIWGNSYFAVAIGYVVVVGILVVALGIMLSILTFRNYSPLDG